MNKTNDREVENILFTNRNEPDLEKPLSPILGCSRPKFLNRKRSHTKTRIQLSKRFELEKNQKKSSEAQIQEFNEDSFTLTEDENLIKCLDRFEEIEKNREIVYKVLLNNKNSNLTFKKPISPAPKKLKSRNSPVKFEEAKLEVQCVKEEEFCEKIEKITYVQQIPVKLPKYSNFQTANGRIISICSDKIEKHSKLFEDIISCSQSENNRKNKFNFLKKPTGSENNTVLNKYQGKTDVEISLTQEMCDSSISNTQIISAVDSLLVDTKITFSETENFNGFDEKEIQESHDLVKHFIQLTKAVPDNIASFCGKHLINDKLFYNLDKNCNLTGNHFGFSTASENKLSVGTNSINKAKFLFLDLDSVNEIEQEVQSTEANSEHTESKTEGERFSNVTGKNLSLCASSLNNISENLDLPTKYNYFSSASGKKLNVTKNSLQKAKNIFEDIDFNIKCDQEMQLGKRDFKKTDSKNTLGLTSGLNIGGFSSASGKKLSVSSNSLNKAKNVFEDIDFNVMCDQETQLGKENIKKSDSYTLGLMPALNYGGFSSASGKKLSVSSNSVNKAKNMFEDLNSNNKCDEETQLEKGDIKKSDSNLLGLMPALDSGGFSSASGIKLPVSSNSIIKAKNIFEDLGFDIKSGEEAQFSKNHNEKTDFSNASNKNNTISDNLKNKFKNDSDIENNKSHALLKEKLKYFDQLIGDDKEFVPNNNFLTSGSDKQDNTNINTGVKHKLDFFDKLLEKGNISSISSFQAVNKPQNVATFSSPLRNSLKKTCDNTTPIKNLNTPEESIKRSKRKLGVSSCKQISVPESILKKAKLIFDEDFSGISPIKPLVQTIGNSQSCSTPLRDNLQTSQIHIDSKETDKVIDKKNNIVKLNDYRNITFDNPIEQNDLDFKDEIKNLEERLTVIKKRQEILEKLRGEKPDCDKKIKQGVLYRAKMDKHRVSLKDFVNREKAGQYLCEDLFCITPQNAANIHFKECSAVVYTADAAAVVPNVKDLVGFNEIEIAFKAMTGVDPKLIHKGWIKNHYKWIIWKLTSYERMFPNMFQGTLNIDNVMQQLKYRYDREIDKVERSALRRIFEKDDAPQKRMVLCISDIKNLTPNTFELELTDGWYSIRTVIDQPLCHQVLNGRLQIGMKLIISGAELMNCEGCHPLDATDLPYLKINFNSTRISKWDTRLGYQRIPGPFSLPIHTVHPQGGLIGSIDVYIARVYPLRYLDKTEIRSVWRNKKAEERRALEWENDRYKTFEKIEEAIRNEFSSIYDKENASKSKRNSSADISNITCPKTLMEAVENSNDPERLQELLTPSQRSALLEYKRNLILHEQQEMADKVKTSTEKLKIANRDVVPVLKLLVVDLNGSPTKSFNFFLWRPSDSYEVLKEETCLTIYKVLPKPNGELYSSNKTTFKHKTLSDHVSAIYKRHLSPIGELNDLKFSTNFSEFDTVGIVIQTTMGSNSQEIWLCDSSGRLLIVNIYESSATCLLFDNLKRGQTISACNLIYRSFVSDICKACANHFTIFSSYPKFKHLQTGLDELNKELPKDINKILEDCDDRIEKFRQKTSSRSSVSATFEELDEDTLTCSRLTSTDIALSLIDMDMFT